ncbi:sigma-70 family RNA polymerase sigma factor [Verrucomicrobiaceae bacterium N1E253]|uniref:Sigma-70 family RNA polymerase sigma factor n=1 Tax=Oceaniferula marina TaxID=2748318 RepID=A0A851GE81_9BACT|nr:sigma-70 family RNA polymerase sigma factor [Oceaniferula marina]NWK54011.1 sigma-70 family RNA polymerase sigma factor [Oceaniferula marina]
MSHPQAEAWKDWLKEHGGRLYMYARQRSSCREDAEDMVQDAMVRLWHYQEERGNTPPDLPLAYSVLRFVAMDYGKKLGRKKRKEEAIIFLHDRDDYWCDSSAEDDEDAHLLRQAVDSLGEKLREVVTLKVWGGLTFNEIAETMAISPNTAASRYRYALEQLERKLEHLNQQGHGSA